MKLKALLELIKKEGKLVVINEDLEPLFVIFDYQLYLNSDFDLEKEIQSRWKEVEFKGDKKIARINPENLDISLEDLPL